MVILSIVTSKLHEVELSNGDSTLILSIHNILTTKIKMNEQVLSIFFSALYYSIKQTTLFFIL